MPSNFRRSPSNKIFLCENINSDDIILNLDYLEVKHLQSVIENQDLFGDLSVYDDDII